MAHEHADLRVRRTHMLLREALIDLIGEKGFDAVTVENIAERAMVNRATFYRHYQDKYALVAGIFQEAADQLISELGPPAGDIETVEQILNEWGRSPEQPDGLAMSPSARAWTVFWEHFARHARLYRAMLGKHGSPWFVAQMRSYTAEMLRQRLLAVHLLARRKADDAATIPEEVIIMSLASWFVGTVTWWLEDGMTYTPFQMAGWSLRLIALGYFPALDSST